MRTLRRGGDTAPYPPLRSESAMGLAHCKTLARIPKQWSRTRKTGVRSRTLKTRSESPDVVCYKFGSAFAHPNTLLKILGNGGDERDDA